MGDGLYSFKGRASRVATKGFYTKSRDEIFTQEQIKDEMNPFRVKIREARDSNEHPNSLAILLALDVTGSMGSIPHYLVQDGLPHIMDKIITKGIADPQILFMGIGDHECDEAPLQIGQFESSDQLLDHWLTSIFLEGGGGANDGESYLLAWYFVGYHTAIDCFEKRKQKGFLFTIGDEPVLKEVPSNILNQIMGAGQSYLKKDQFCSALELLDKARETYIVKHLHLKEGQNGHRQDVMDGWKQIMGDDLLIVENKNDIPDIISKTIMFSHLLDKPVKQKEEELYL